MGGHKRNSGRILSIGPLFILSYESVWFEDIKILSLEQLNIDEHRDSSSIILMKTEHNSEIKSVMTAITNRQKELLNIAMTKFLKLKI